MERTLTPVSSEPKSTANLYEALGSSLDIRLVLERAYPFLVSLVPADYGALGISSTGRPEDFEWIEARLPGSFFAAYPRMAPYDFVRKAVVEQPNVVLRDDEMVSRRELEDNVMYRHAREIGVHLEQVMAVMLHIDNRWQSGLSLYRDTRRPFSEGEKAILQEVTPMLVNAVRNCHLFGDAADKGSALDALLHTGSEAVLICDSSGREVLRTPSATPLIEKWLSAGERPPGNLPSPLRTLLARAAASPSSPTLHQWRKSNDDATLEVTLLPLSACMGKARWMLRLLEIPHAIPLPPEWEPHITAKEREVVEGVLHGWTNEVIASDLPCAPNTVKKHLQNSFDKLGLSSRAALIVRAALSWAARLR